MYFLGLTSSKAKKKKSTRCYQSCNDTSISFMPTEINNWFIYTDFFCAHISFLWIYKANSRNRKHNPHLLSYIMVMITSGSGQKSSLCVLQDAFGALNGS